MRKIGLIPFLFLGMVACNDSGSKTGETATDTTAAASASMDTTHKATDTVASVPAVPEIPAGAKVFFKNLKNGQKIKSPFKVQMGVSGIALDSAGVIKPASGHHHILIDNGDSLALGTVVPKDSTHLHFGNAQKEAELKLTPGEHKLTLQYADGIHRSYGGKLASSVTVTVQ
ncbi:MAG: DUF4399 domain-containing protein [Niastella sp.]|uniref:DUF4399 domain-containing protein n=1 Tax=Niastella sp. TaxID=1869183 RepID=UPI00389A0DA8